MTVPLWCPGVHQEAACGQLVEAGDPAPLLGPREAISGMPCSGLLSTTETSSYWRRSKEGHEVLRAWRLFKDWERLFGYSQSLRNLTQPQHILLWVQLPSAGNLHCPVLLLACSGPFSLLKECTKAVPDLLPSKRENCKVNGLLRSTFTDLKKWPHWTNNHANKMISNNNKLFKNFLSFRFAVTTTLNLVVQGWKH